MDNQQPSFQKTFFIPPMKGYGYIYKYTSPSGKSYIGQTMGSLYSRAKSISTGIGYKKCSLFWKAIQKYGWSNFEVFILAELPIEKLNEAEQNFIQLYRTLSPNGYNLSSGGEGGKKVPVYTYSAQNGEFLERYNSVTEASLFTEVPIETISAILHNDGRKQAHNIVFLTNYVEFYDIKQLARANYHKVYVYDMDGIFIQDFISIQEASRSLSVAEGSIRKCLNGTAFFVKNYRFDGVKYDKMPVKRSSKEPISVEQIDATTGEKIAEYPSLAEAARAVGLASGAGIKKVITRGKGLSGGFFWKKKEGSTTKSE